MYKLLEANGLGTGACDIIMIEKVKATGDVWQLLSSLQVADTHQIREAAPWKRRVCPRIPSWKVTLQKKKEETEKKQTKKRPPPTRHHKTLLTSSRPQGGRLYSRCPVLPHTDTWARLSIVHLRDGAPCCAAAVVKSDGFTIVQLFSAVVFLPNKASINYCT